MNRNFRVPIFRRKVKQKKASQSRANPRQLGNGETDKRTSAREPQFLAIFTLHRGLNGPPWGATMMASRCPRPHAERRGKREAEVKIIEKEGSGGRHRLGLALFGSCETPPGPEQAWQKTKDRRLERGRPAVVAACPLRRQRGKRGNRKRTENSQRDSIPCSDCAIVALTS